jgi:hypothetical protein
VLRHKDFHRNGFRVAESVLLVFGKKDAVDINSKAGHRAALRKLKSAYSGDLG